MRIPLFEIEFSTELSRTSSLCSHSLNHLHNERRFMDTTVVHNDNRVGCGKGVHVLEERFDELREQSRIERTFDNRREQKSVQRESRKN